MDILLCRILRRKAVTHTWTIEWIECRFRINEDGACEPQKDTSVWKDVFVTTASGPKISITFWVQSPIRTRTLNLFPWKVFSHTWKKNVYWSILMSVRKTYLANNPHFWWTADICLQWFSGRCKQIVHHGSAKLLFRLMYQMALLRVSFRY